MGHNRFTGSEDIALRKLIEAQERVSWSKVAQELEALGFEKRTPKSVRNRHLRWKRAQSGVDGLAKNYCRKCKKKQRGHVCVLEEECVPAGFQNDESKNE
ncbi:MAG: hypothetical protein CMI29_08350 [Opitutae bacterium]|nr:hypothetical protein [Opitutae bacterium]|tara:strand:+ start:2015 stop:2314 length:300 start_codon:yes stop_codon:yes gene_type:complete